MRERSWTAWIASVKGTFVPLLMGLLLALVASPLAERWPAVSAALISFVLATGLLAVHRGLLLRACMVVGLAFVLVLRWTAHGYGGENRVLVIISHVAVSGFLLMLVIICLAVVLRHQQITRDTVLGAICGYLLIAFVFAFAYAVVNDVQPGSFTTSIGPPAAGDAARTGLGPPQLVYFSFATLTTLGYGDIVPVSEAARSLAILEMLSGPLYLAAFVARLVGIMGAQSRGGAP